MQIKSFSDYLVEDTKEVTFVFGRFNPPTIGHEKLFDQTKKLARSGTYRIYGSKSVDPKKNPLGFKDKVKFIRKMFPKHARQVMADKDVRNVLDIAVKLYDQGFTKVQMVAGSDRVKEFEVLLNKYNGEKSRHGFYEFQGMIKVLSAGERDPDAEGVSGMSASKMRQAAVDGKLQIFAKGVPARFHPTDLYNAVRSGMGLKAEGFRPHINLEKVSDVREDYVDERIFRIGSMVKLKESGEVGKVVIRGSNYILAEFNGKKRRCWLDSIQEEGGAGEYGTDKLTKKYKKDTPKMEIVDSPYNKIVKDNTTLTFGKKKDKKEGYNDGDSSRGDKNYDSFKTGKKSTDAKRRAQQNKQKDMKDDNPDAYKDLPGDKKARAKGLPQSKFTSKYKQMYGEDFEITFEDFIIEGKGQATKALKKKSDATGVSMSVLNKVFDRGYAAWKTGHKPGTTPVQWGLARVNSFLVGGPVWQKFDADQAKIARAGGFSPKRG
jgi:nicotinamide mononucleotide adenylyltransferase